MIAHLWEACCAYYNFDKEADFTADLLSKTVNLWHEYEDPVLEFHLRQENPSLLEFMFDVHRAQLELQYHPGHVHLGRSICFARLVDSLLPDQETPNQFKIAVEILCTLWAGFEKRSTGIPRGELLNILRRMGYAESSATAILSQCSRSVEQFGSEYRRRLKDAPRPTLWRQMVPQLVDGPIAESGGVLYVPHPPLLFRWLAEKYFLDASVGGNRKLKIAFGKAWELYIKQLLGQLVGAENVFDLNQVDETESEKADFLALSGQTAIVVECKFTTLRCDYISKAAVFGSTAVNDVVNGVGQTISSAERLSEICKRVGREPSAVKNVLRLVVAFGEIPGINSPDFWSEYLLPQLEKRSFTVTRIDAQPTRPQVLCALAFEGFVALCSSAKADPYALVQERVNSNYHVTGDWRQFMRARIEAAGGCSWQFWNDESNALLTGLVDRMRKGGLEPKSAS